MEIVEQRVWLRFESSLCPASGTIIPGGSKDLSLINGQAGMEGRLEYHGIIGYDGEWILRELQAVGFPTDHIRIAEQLVRWDHLSEAAIFIIIISTEIGNVTGDWTYCHTAGGGLGGGECRSFALWSQSWLE